MSNDAVAMLGMVLGAAFTWIGILAGRKIEWQLHRYYCACERCVRFQGEEIHRMERAGQREK